MTNKLLNWRRKQRKGIPEDGRFIRHMTQQEAAEHFSVCIRTYCNWESGSTKTPGYILENLI